MSLDDRRTQAGPAIPVTIVGAEGLSLPVEIEGTVPVSGTVGISGTVPISGTVTATPTGTQTVEQIVYTTTKSGELQGSATALQLPNITCKLVKFKARDDNAGNVYLGAAGVTKPEGITDTTTGLQLDAGDDSGWIPVDNLNRFYRICDNTGDDLTYMALE